MLRRSLVTVALSLACGAGVSAQSAGRWTPPRDERGPLTQPVVEEGASGEISVIRLATGQKADDLLFYDKDSGAALLVVNHGIYKPGQSDAFAPLLQFETLCLLQLAPGLDLTAVKQDDDARDDIVGYQKSTGDVYRYYRRGEGCQ